MDIQKNFWTQKLSPALEEPIQLLKVYTRMDIQDILSECVALGAVQWVELFFDSQGLFSHPKLSQGGKQRGTQGVKTNFTREKQAELTRQLQKLTKVFNAVHSESSFQHLKTAITTQWGSSITPDALEDMAAYTFPNEDDFLALLQMAWSISGESDRRITCALVREARSKLNGFRKFLKNP